MPEPIPNVPLEHCEKTIKALGKVIDSMNSSGRMVARDTVVSLLNAVQGDLKLLAIEIQQDQSGEI